MNLERDKFLTEAIGECWHEWKENRCACGFYKSIFSVPPSIYETHFKKNPDFSTWSGFGKLWEWAKGQVWFIKFLQDETFIGTISSLEDKYSVINPIRFKLSLYELINPDRFADAVYEFLKEKK